MSQQTEAKPDVVEFLEQQHETIRDLFGQLRSAGSGEKKDELFQCLVRLLAVHETAEEMVVHPQARLAETGNEIVELRVGEESKAKDVLKELEDMGVDDPGFDAKLKTFEQAVLDHARREEDEEFPLLYEVHDEKVLERMTAMIQVAEGIAPTHPHPHGPDGALGNMVVGPFVSMVDRAKDAFKDLRS